MNGGSLSQEEIDALVNGGADGAAAPDESVPDETAEVETAEESAAAEREEPHDLTPVERDTIGEVGNICMSSAATALSALLGHPVQITTPMVRVVTDAEVRQEFARPAARVVIEYTAGLDGRNVFILSTGDASVVADLMMGGPGTPSDQLTELHASAIGEAMNQMMGSAATAMAEMLGRRVDISAPQVELPDSDPDPSASELLEHAPVVSAGFQLRVGDLLDTSLMQLMPIDFVRALVDGLTADAAPAPEPVAVDPVLEQAAVPEELPPLPPPPPLPSDEPDDRHLRAVPVPVAQPVTFPSLDAVPSVPGGSDISLLLDVPLQVTVELGRTQLRIREVLELVPGSIVELDKLAGEPVDVLVNGKQIARGEVVVIDEEFGVRITDVASQAKRLRGLAAEDA